MTFDEIWKQLMGKQPKLDKADADVTFKAENLKALLRQVYEQGRQSAPRGSAAADMFSGIFGVNK